MVSDNPHLVSSHCRVMGNEIADEQAQIGAATNQEGVRHHYNSAKATIRRVARGEKISHVGIRQLYGAKGEELDHIEESKLYRIEQMTMGQVRSGHHSDLKYWLHMIGRAVDNICRKFEFWEKTAGHVVYDCPRIHHPIHLRKTC